MVNFHEMMKIERALWAKLDAVWGMMAAEVWAQVSDCLEKGRFDLAREIANSLTLKSVGERNREWVKYYLYRAGVFGGRTVSPTAGAPAVTMGSFEKTLDNVANQFIAQMDRHATEPVRDQLLQLIATAEESRALVQKAWDHHVRVRKEYNESQPRDESGRWTSGGGWTPPGKYAQWSKHTDSGGDWWENPDTGELLSREDIEYEINPPPPKPVSQKRRQLATIDPMGRDISKMDAKMRDLEEAQSWAHLTPQERYSFVSYTGVTGHDANWDTEGAGRLDETIEKLEMPETTTVYRGLTGKTFNLPEGREPTMAELEALKGKTFTDPIHASTTLDEELAFMFGPGREPDAVQIRFDVPKGAKAAVIGNAMGRTIHVASPDPDDGEFGEFHVLLPSKQQYRVKGIEQYNGKPRLVVDLVTSVKKADDDRFVKEFVSFKKTGDERMQLISSLHTSRLAAWGGLAEAKTLGARRYRIVEQDDNRTCEFCAEIDGTEFDVDTGSERIREILGADPDDLENLAPFADTTKDFIGKMKSMSAEELQEEGYDVPPFHPGCRGVVVPVFDDEDEAPTVNQAGDIEQEEFEFVGQRVGKDFVDQWNGGIKRPPAELLAALSGRPQQEVLNATRHDEKFFSFTGDGSLKMRYKDKSADMSMVYDPLVGKLYKNFAEFRGEPDQAATWLRGALSRMVKLGETLAAKEFVARATGAYGARAYAMMGFVPASTREWFDLQEAISKDVRPGGKLHSLFKDDEQKYKLVLSLLDTKDPKGFQVLAALPEGPAMLAGRDLNVKLVLGDSSARAMFNEAIR